MKTVLYADSIDNTGKRVENIIHTQVPRIQVKTCNSINLFSELFRQPLNNISVAILLITSKDELVQFNLIKTFLDNIRVILILPDRQKNTLALGHKLKTSFISYVDNDLQGVVSVLEQIQRKTAKEIK